MRAVAVLPVALAAAGCGSAPVEPGAGGAASGPRELGPRYGISITLPAGWSGRITRGAVQAATLPLASEAAGWVHEDDARRLAEDDVVVSLFETAPENTSPPIDRDEYPPLTRPLAFETADFENWDGFTDDSRLTGHGFGRTSFELSGRLSSSSSRPDRRLPLLARCPG
ncbi:MAG TPA: hypothetical protein VI540_07525 [Gaiellaceae bacterium]|nr:hypothetical protein [Gaiellaceae bacterium]